MDPQIRYSDTNSIIFNCPKEYYEQVETDYQSGKITKDEYCKEKIRISKEFMNKIAKSNGVDITSGEIKTYPIGNFGKKTYGK